MTFARRQFELSKTQEDGQPLLAHLQSFERQTGRLHELIATAPPLPDGLQSLWDNFLALHESRGTAGFGVARITFADMDSFQRVTGVVLSPWEVEQVRKLDSLWLTEFAPKPKGDK